MADSRAGELCQWYEQVPERLWGPEQTQRTCALFGSQHLFFFPFSRFILEREKENERAPAKAGGAEG